MSSSNDFAWQSSMVDDQRRREQEEKRKADEDYIRRQEAKTKSAWGKYSSPCIFPVKN